MIPYSTQLIDEDDIQAITEVLRSSHLTQGPVVEAFEQSLCDYTGSKYAVTFNSATSALMGAYAIAGIGQDDEIITTPISFVATSNMAIALGAKPVFCDVKLDGNIDERLIERLITSKTKAIVPVHFGGKPVALEKIKEISKKHRLLVIEDASHALGSEINGKKIGSLSDMTIFSFHAIKPITTGEGGAVLTDNAEYAEKLRRFRSHGIVKKKFWNSDMVEMGYNYRLTDISAALGLSQMKKLDHFIKQRNEIAAYYDERFKGHKLFQTIPIPQNERSARHLYPITLIPGLHCPKEDVFAALHEKGIGVQVHYKPIHLNSFYIEKYGKQSLSVAEDFYRSELSLPCQQKMTIEDAVYVADNFLEILEEYRIKGCSF
ncbi:MAG: UDP-4-amino-4,6-dideoxy-N-acetyl-beta-L-altrosamine transaminase [Campylobacterales bacterium]|nr:UDP-4-amino-4,6-dideoxy-N-acetyl-beta-L-altrosamine transaminase [Campylobacterales bacterium]